MLFRSNDTATTEIYTTRNTLSLHDALPIRTAEIDALQKAAYPEVRPIVVDLEPAQAYQLALRAVDDVGWRIVDANPPNLRVDGVAQIQAVVRSLLFGFADDIAIRIRPLASQTRIDLRSSSRVGKHDFGANARRIDRFAAAVKEEMQEP